MVILSIADFHMTAGPNGSMSDAFTDNLNTFTSLLLSIQAQEPDWAPDYLCICGDIAGRGATQEYELANQAITQIASAARLSRNYILMVPGNHDLDLSAIDLKIKDIDPGIIKQYYRSIHEQTVKWLEKGMDAKNPAPEHIKNMFRNYAKFRKDNLPNPDDNDAKYTPLCLTTFPADMSHLCGFMVYERDKTVFIELNSSWCDIRSIREVHFGRTIIDQLYHKIQKYKRQGYYVVAMFHHSLRFLDLDEYQSRSRLPVYDRIIELADLCLSGHEHGAESKDPDFLGNTCQYILNAGFYSKDPHNSLMESGATLIKIDRYNELLQIRKLLRKPNDKWLEPEGIKTYSTKERLIEPRLGTISSKIRTGNAYTESDRRTHERIAIELFGEGYAIKTTEFAGTYILASQKQDDTQQLPRYVTFVNIAQLDLTTFSIPECKPSSSHIVIFQGCRRSSANGHEQFKKIASLYRKQLLCREITFVAI